MKPRILLLVTVLMARALVLAACPGGETPAPAAEEPAAAAPAEATEAPAAEPTEAPAEEAAAEEPTATPEAEEEVAAEEEAAAEEAPAEEAAAEEPADVVLNTCEEGAPSLTIWTDDTRSEILQSVGAEFESATGVCVSVVEKGFGDIRDDLKVAGPAGEGADIIIGAHDWLGELVENGLLSPIEMTDDLQANFLDAALQAFVYDGELYGIPYATENVAFVYNPELVETAPATWSEVTEIATQLEADGVVSNGYLIQTNDPYHFFPIQTAFGGYVFGLTDEGYNPEDLGIDSEGTLAAFNWLNDMVEAGHIVDSVNYDTMHAGFENGETAMIITGPWALPRIRESGIPYAVSKIPGEVQDAQPFLGVQGFMVNAFTADPLLAQTFLRDFVATQDVMQAIYDADPRPSAFIAVRDAISDADQLAFAEAGANGLPMPAIPAMSAVWSAWGSAMN
ncbi:MAG: maltose ABC transporter substrate-binding protein [Caldilineaceae bacterium]